MDNPERNPRIELFRAAVVLQAKLVVDGLRDAALIPLSLVAALIGLLRGGADCDREFRQVIRLGRRSEQWINLFGHRRPLHGSAASSMDAVLDHVEQTVRDRYQKRPEGADVDAEPGGEGPAAGSDGPGRGTQ